VGYNSSDDDASCKNEGFDAVTTTQEESGGVKSGSSRGETPKDCNAKKKKKKTKKKTGKKKKKKKDSSSLSTLPSADSLLERSKDEVPDFLAASVSREKEERETKFLEKMAKQLEVKNEDEKDVPKTKNVASKHNSRLSVQENLSMGDSKLSSKDRQNKRKWKPKHGFDAIAVKTNKKKLKKGDGSYDAANIKTYERMMARGMTRKADRFLEEMYTKS